MARLGGRAHWCAPRASLSTMRNRIAKDAKNRMNRTIARQASPIVVSVEQACHAGGRAFESRRSRPRKFLQIDRLCCLVGRGNRTRGPNLWSKHLSEKPCKHAISGKRSVGRDPFGGGE